MGPGRGGERAAEGENEGDESPLQPPADPWPIVRGRGPVCRVDRVEGGGPKRRIDARHIEFWRIKPWCIKPWCIDLRRLDRRRRRDSGSPGCGLGRPLLCQMTQQLSHRVRRWLARGQNDIRLDHKGVVRIGILWCQRGLHWRSLTGPNVTRIRAVGGLTQCQRSSARLQTPVRFDQSKAEGWRGYGDLWRQGCGRGAGKEQGDTNCAALRIGAAYPVAPWFARRCKASSGDASQSRAPPHEDRRRSSSWIRSR